MIIIGSAVYVKLKRFIERYLFHMFFPDIFRE